MVAGVNPVAVRARRHPPVFAIMVALLATSCSSGSDEVTAPTTGSTEGTDAAATTAAPSTTIPATDPTNTAGTPQEIPPSGDLYASPDPIPDQPHGTLLRYQEITPSVHTGSRTWRMMYLSESVAGDPIVVTGVAVVPEAPAPPDGRNIVTLTHGTTGSADRCAPSKAPGAAGELLLLGPTVASGSIIAATDYEGLGTPGAHPYLVGVSEGRSGLDAALAARRLPHAEAGTQLGVMGYSQGGHGAMWAAELAAEWAPELTLVGTFAGAPPTEISLILGVALPGGSSSFIYLLVAGYAEAYGDDADPATFFTPAGLRRLDLADELCVGELFGALADVGSGAYVPGAGSEPPWSRLARRNDAGTKAVDAPLLIIHSAADDIVPAALSEIAFNRLCSLGQVVERRVPPEGTHGGAAPPAYEAAQVWMQARFDTSGPDAVSTCPDGAGFGG
ncbi:hypothetical protein BH20ACT4_BH20ACT4_14240 [soil metagenome]